jgi:hypothetical protein
MAAFQATAAIGRQSPDHARQTCSLRMACLLQTGPIAKKAVSSIKEAGDGQMLRPDSYPPVYKHRQQRTAQLAHN